MNITKNFTLEELTNSQTAKLKGIDNTPGPEEEFKLHLLCEKILQPIRDKYGKSIIISSGFRCKKLNSIIGGAKNSQHVKGEAADIHSLSDSPRDNKELFDLIFEMINKGDIECGQMINEYNYNWIHISLPTSKFKNQILHIG